MLHPHIHNQRVEDGPPLREDVAAGFAWGTYCAALGVAALILAGSSHERRVRLGRWLCGDDRSVPRQEVREPPPAVARIVDVEAGVAFLQHPHAMEVEWYGVYAGGSRKYVVTRGGLVREGEAIGRFTVRGIREDAIVLEDDAASYLVEMESGACIAHFTRLQERSPRW